MNIRELCAEEVRQSGFTHVARITHKDLAAFGAVTSGVLKLQAINVGWFIDRIAFKLVTPFDGGATSGLALDVGWNATSGSDDPDGLLDNYELHKDGTEVLAGLGNGAAFAANATGYAALEATDLEALFTATGGNLNALTEGEVLIFWRAVNTAIIEP